MKQKLFNFFQKLSRAFLLPIVLISFASMILGVASVFLWHDQLKEMLPFINTPVVQYIAQIMNTMSGAIMNNISLLFAVSLAFGMADEDREYAALGGLVGYLAFLMGMGTLINLVPDVAAMFPESAIKSILGITTIDTGMIGGIIVGLLAALIHNKTRKTKLPMAFSLFSGNRFVPLVCSVFFVVLGQVFPFVWAVISEAINAAAMAVAGAGVFAPFLYGFGERLLIPTGLHHVWNAVIRDTAVSGIYTFPTGEVIEGSRIAFNHFLSTNAMPLDTTLPDFVKFLRGGQVPMTMFALPAIALAMYHTAKPENKKTVKALLITGVFSIFIAGVTEPLEFAFMFVAPLLYLVYAILTGLSFMISFLLGNGMGGAEPNIIGLLLYGVLRPESNYYIVLLLGIPFAIVSYFLFKWWIIKFDVKTPGRGGDYDNAVNMEDADGETDPIKLKAKTIIKGLGGKENIDVVDCCISRLRVKVKDMSKVDESILQATGSMGIVKADDHNIQVIYGTSVSMIKSAVAKALQ
ncbi:MAG: PTS transporter subunit EIIC [Cellulosilyticaceae bacterium]